MNRVKIVLDADVIIHFSKGDMLSILPNIFPNYNYIVLDKVYEEILGDIKTQLDNQITFLKNISIENFNPKGEQLKEYAYLLKKFGKGESASMVYCKWNRDIIGSSNLKDIKDYCIQNNIVYLTTFDFLFFAVRKDIISQKQACAFIESVIKKNSKLPSVEEFKKTYQQSPKQFKLLGEME